ncbi:MAG TPA: hypothetical protein VG779_01850 [Actinomycetota bacterium]|nr:hypothetical protein [Actinomycetota bacterium]
MVFTVVFGSAVAFGSVAFGSALTLAFGSAFAFASADVADEDADLPDAVSFVVDALAVDLVTGGRAGALALLLGLPAVLLGMLFPTRGTRGVVAPTVDGYIKRGAGSRA